MFWIWYCWQMGLIEGEYRMYMCNPDTYRYYEEVPTW